MTMMGKPWTDTKLAEAIQNVNEKRYLEFEPPFDDLTWLPILDEEVFRRNPKMELSISERDSTVSHRAGTRISQAFMQALSRMRHVKRLRVSFAVKQTFHLDGGMRQLERLNLVGNPNSWKDVDTAVLLDLPNLENLCISAARADLSPVSALSCLRCLELDIKRPDYTGLLGLAGLPGLEDRPDKPHLEDIILCGAVPSLAFLDGLRVENMMLDCADISADPNELSAAHIRRLLFSSNRNITDLSFLGGCSALEYLQVYQSHPTDLWDFSRLTNLRFLELRHMRKLASLEPLAAAPELCELYLEEINAKLGAEAFRPLISMPNLRKLRIDFLDSGVKRRQAVRELFRLAGKEHILTSGTPAVQFGSIVREKATESKTQKI